MNTIREIADSVAKVVTLPGMDQGVGYWRVNGECCIGARLAFALEVDGMRGEYQLGHLVDFLRGAEEFARRIGGNRAHLIVMLREAGAGDDPFSSEDWKAPVEVVWENLSRMEALPTLVSAHLEFADLSSADLRGADLRGANLAHSDLIRADLRGADLRGANLYGAEMIKSVLCKADLRGADMREAVLYDSLRYKTQLDGANLQGTCFDMFLDYRDSRNYRGLSAQR